MFSIQVFNSGFLSRGFQNLGGQEIKLRKQVHTESNRVVLLTALVARNPLL